ncbi:myocardin isoform X3 [Antennarius striatus]|uniref:myocardin isoform X3 n=1 Tax=Antennarius striatus TaxID=241820 RepID=UPI0035AD947F
MTLLGSEHSILIRSKFRSVLQLRLQQRRTREQLADQEIMPLNHGKFPKQEDSYAFEEDSSSESLSPEQHHSDESQGSACPSSEAAGSAPSSSSSPALTSPRQITFPEPPLTAPHSPGVSVDVGLYASDYKDGTGFLCDQGSAARDPPDQVQEEGLSAANNGQASPPIPVPAIVKSKVSDKNRHKKPKDVKPKVKKLKYHQYIPPDQKAEKSPPPMDSAYARLLQQQQLFLQLQILSQQKHTHTHPQSQQHTHTLQTQPQQRQPAFSYQPHPQTQNQKSSGEQLSACSSSGPPSQANSNASSPLKNTYPHQSNISQVKPGPLPGNLDDLKVSELRQHLRIRGMPVSGTKTALIERLRPFKDSNAASSPSSDITAVTFPVTPTGSLSSYQSPSSSSALGSYYPYPSTSSTPPISPASSELSLSGSLPDSFSDVPMSSPTQFALQSSPVQLSVEDGLGGRGLGGGDGGGMDGAEAEKDKMLVEKQKVIEELTWKLHQEQRQVEELKMQLHKRKRCYGATQDPLSAPPHPSMHHQHPPDMMGPHFFGVTIKQEPIGLSSSCPLTSAKQMKNSTGSCMEDLHCNAPLPNMGGPGSAQCMDTAPTSGSPSTMSAFLSPQRSPQDSPIGKPSSSPQPSSPNNPYLLSPPVGRDGCPHPQGNNRARSMQMQQKNGGQVVNCSYPADKRGIQGVFPNSSDCGSAKAENHNMQPKMSVVPSSRHVGQKCQVSPPAFSSSDSDASDLRQPPCYEDAVKQQLTRSQQMDELLDVLIESGEIPANAREERGRSFVTKVVPHITVSPGCPSLLIPRFHRHYEHLPPAQLPYDHSANPIAESHLETLLGSAIGRGGGGEVALLKMATEDRGQEDEGNRDGEGYGSPHPHHHRHPSEVQGMVSMTFSETPWETMEWLDLTPPSSATAFNVAPPSGPNIFNTEFLDVTDINLNSAMDLHLEHW